LRSLEKTLHHVPLLHSLSDDELRPLAEQVQVRTYPPGSTIVAQGKAGQTLYIILAGRVRVLHHPRDRSEPAALAALAELARGKLRAKLPQLERALAGQFGAHQRFLVARQLAHLDFLDESLEPVSAEITERLRPFEPASERLDTIPGVGRCIAEILLAEVGPDLSRFPTAAHLASRAGMCPGNHESAGQRQSGRTRKGNAWLRGALAEAGQAAGRTKHTYLGAQYRRLVARRGKKKATIAVGHTILIIAYHLLTRGTTDQELGVRYFDERDRHAVERRPVRRLEALGNKVMLEPIDPAA
jgi:hypothetical protein